MAGLRVLAGLAALTAHGPALASQPESAAEHIAAPPVAAAPPDIAANPLMADSTMLANALTGQALQLTMRGTTVGVVASAVPAEDGCAALISAHAPGMSRKWNRLFRWSEIAWTGTTPDGGTMVSFFEHEGRLPVDRMEFSPLDGAGFRATLDRLASNCRAARGEAERFAVDGKASERGCYFARLPGLNLLGSRAAPAATPPRAMLTVLARETPEADLQLLLERAAPGAAGDGDDWGRPWVAFTFADPRLKDMRIASAAFALDGKPAIAQHAIAAYGDTRVRISMDPLRSTAGGKAMDGFYRRLASTGEVTLTLLDRERHTQAVLNFDAGPALAAARKALNAADWSCGGANPAPAPAAEWQPAG